MDDDAIILAGGDALLGRVTRGRRGGAAARMLPRKAVSAAKVNRMVEDLPGASSRVMRQFFGLELFQFANGGLTSIRKSDIVLRSFQMDRVFMTRANVGAASPNLVVTVTSFKVGAEEMIVGGFGIPLSMFATDATGSMFKGYTAKAGLPIAVTLGISAAPAAAEFVNVQFGAYGDAVGA
jgi:hypothetical protein